MTSIVAMAVGQKEITMEVPCALTPTADYLPKNKFEEISSKETLKCAETVEFPEDTFTFTKHTRSIVLGMQNRAVQSMLDFDFVCSRTVPSVCAIVYPMKLVLLFLILYRLPFHAYN